MVSAGKGFRIAEHVFDVALDSYPLPDIQLDASAVTNSDKENTVTAVARDASFRNVAKNVGLNHAFELTGEKIESGFAMYHQAGGGVGSTGL